MVGVSADATRPSFFAMKYLQARGYQIYPINPVTSAREILGKTVYPNLKELPCQVDMVDIFRNSKAAGPLTDEAIEHPARVVWMQLGVINLEAARRAERRGLHVVMNRCPKIEYARLRGELSWFGINSRTLSSQWHPINRLN